MYSFCDTLITNLGLKKKVKANLFPIRCKLKLVMIFMNMIIIVVDFTAVLYICNKLTYICCLRLIEHVHRCHCQGPTHSRMLITEFCTA